MTLHVALLEKSDVVILNNEKTMLKRKHPVPDNDDSMDRTIYAVRRTAFACSTSRKSLSPMTVTVSETNHAGTAPAFLGQIRKSHEGDDEHNT